MMPLSSATGIKRGRRNESSRWMAPAHQHFMPIIREVASWICGWYDEEYFVTFHRAAQFVLQAQALDRAQGHVIRIKLVTVPASLLAVYIEASALRSRMEGWLPLSG